MPVTGRLPGWDRSMTRDQQRGVRGSPDRRRAVRRMPTDRGKPAVMSVMTTGELSRRTGLPVKAVREYADAGLIYSVGRTAAGYRLFADEALWCVEVIRGLRALGLTVAEIHSLIEPDHQIGVRLSHLLDTARARLIARIEESQQMLARIEAFEAEHRPELAGDMEFDTGDPRRR